MKKPALKTAFVVFDSNHRMLNIYTDKLLAERRIEWLVLNGDRNLYFREITYWYTH
jgi:hypothetical protein